MTRIKDPSSSDSGTGDDDTGGSDDYPPGWRSGWGWEENGDGAGDGDGGDDAGQSPHQISGEIVTATGAAWLRQFYGAPAADDTPTEPAFPFSLGVDSLPLLPGLPPLPPLLPPDDASPPAPSPWRTRTTAPMGDDGSEGVDAGTMPSSTQQHWHVPRDYPLCPPPALTISGAMPAITEPAGPLWERMGPRARQAWRLSPRGVAWWSRRLLARTRDATGREMVSAEPTAPLLHSGGPISSPAAAPVSPPASALASAPRAQGALSAAGSASADTSSASRYGQPSTATLVRELRAQGRAQVLSQPRTLVGAVRGEGEPRSPMHLATTPPSAAGMPPAGSAAPERIAPFFQQARRLPTIQGRERIGQFVWDLSMRHEPHVLVSAFLSSVQPYQILAPAHALLPESISPSYLADAMLYPSSSTRWSLDESIERSPLFRFVAALCWVRMVAETELAAAAAGMERIPRVLYDIPVGTVGPDFAMTFSPIAAVLGVSFAPCPPDPRLATYSRRRHGPAWTPWRARYYSYLLRLVTSLLCPMRKLDAQTMEYLDGQIPAPAGRARYDQIARSEGAHHLPVGSSERREAADLAWETYLDWLAAYNNVPRLLIDWRLNLCPWSTLRGGRVAPYEGMWTLQTLEQWQQCVSMLCRDLHELAVWRKRAAHFWSVRSEDELTLWLLDPIVSPTA